MIPSFLILVDNASSFWNCPSIIRTLARAFSGVMVLLMKELRNLITVLALMSKQTN